MIRLHTVWERIAGSAWGRMLIALIASACLTLTAAHPAMFGTLPKSDDGLMHLYRLVALDYSVRHGDLWPRYSPGMAFGYGIPTFNYYSPLSLYPMEALHLAFGLRPVDAFLWGVMLYLFFGTLGAYLLGAAWGGPLVGLGTAAAYTYAPYMLINWTQRGAIAELLALALLTWTMWAFRRLSLYGRRRDFALAVGCFTLLILTHNITALIGAALLAAYSVLLWWVSPQPPRAFIWLGLALLFPLALAAIYWMPALFELDYVQIWRASSGVEVFGPGAFQTIGQLLALPHTADLTQLRVLSARPLGWPQLVLAALGAAFTIWDKGVKQRSLYHWLGFAAPLAAVLALMQMPLSAGLWRAIPLLAFVQFPWRLTGPLSLLLSVLAGAGVALVAQRIRQPALRIAWVGIALLLTIVAATPWLYSTYVPDAPTASIVEVQNFERRTNFIGGTAAGEYLPRWVAVMPDPDRLLGLYAQADVIPRLQPSSAVVVEDMAWDMKGAALTLQARVDTRLTFDWLYFPGWWAELDGERVTVTPSEPNGFVSVEVPAGEHHLRLGFGPTPLRRAAMWVSIAALVIWGTGLAFLRIWGGVQEEADRVVRQYREAGPIFAAVLLAALTAFGGKVLVFDRVNTPIRQERFAYGVEKGLQTPVLATIGGKVRLLGYDLPRARVASGGRLHITLYWSPAEGAIGEDLASVLMLRDGEGNIVQQMLEYYPAGVPTSTWLPGFYVQEPLTLEIPPGTPPGSYLLQVGMYSEVAGRNLDVLNVDGSPVGVLADLAMIEVTRPARPASVGRLPIEGPLNAHLNRMLTLIAIQPLPAEAEVGQEIAVVWYWRATARPDADYRARLLWLDEEDEIAASTPPVMLAVGYPTDQWRRRDLWRGLHLLYVPGRLEAGTYKVAVQLVTPSGEAEGERVLIGEMVVHTPPRRYEVPPMDVIAEVGWENGITLLGYDLPQQRLRPGDGLNLTLYWQAQNEIPASLTAFVHLINEEGRIVAQRDQIPVGGTRPTSGWAPGEVISDAYGILIPQDLPPGAYRLRIGWYHAARSERVHLADGSDHWLLPQVITITER